MINIITKTNMFADTQSMRINLEKTDDPDNSVKANSYNSNYLVDNMNKVMMAKIILGLKKSELLLYFQL